MKAFVVLISGVLLASPALAQPMDGGPSGSGAALAADNQNAPEGTGAASERAGEREPRICRRVGSSSVSRLGGQRVCRTAEQWRRAQRSR